MADVTSKNTVMADQLDAKLMAFGKQAAARSADKETAIFVEIGKTLTLLLDHPALKEDLHFNALVTNLAGADGMDEFYNRVVAIDAYVRKVAIAHGLEPSAVSYVGPDRFTIVQIPDHMSDLEEAELPRTRLNMRT